MWYLCSEPYKTLDEARLRAIDIGRENFDSIHKDGWRLWIVLYWRWIDRQM